jgi:nucleoside-diphosphate-sugar epimerase
MPSRTGDRFLLSVDATLGMNVLVTGAYGRAGSAIIEHLGSREEYRFTYLDRSDPPIDIDLNESDTIVADVSDDDAVRRAFEGQDAVVHLAAAAPQVGTTVPWPDLLDSNIVGTYNVAEAAREASVETVVFGSSNHVVGTYRTVRTPEIYGPADDFEIDDNAPLRPQSLYGVTKVFGEQLGRYYVDHEMAPKQ